MFRNQKWSMAFILSVCCCLLLDPVQTKKTFASTEIAKISICCLQPVPLLDADPQGLLGPRNTKGLHTGLEKWVGGGWVGRWVSFVEGTAGDVVSEMPAP